jgi:hypothetical protein
MSYRQVLKRPMSMSSVVATMFKGAQSSNLIHNSNAWSIRRDRVLVGIGAQEGSFHWKGRLSIKCDTPSSRHVIDSDEKLRVEALLLSNKEQFLAGRTPPWLSLAVARLW